MSKQLKEDQDGTVWYGGPPPHVGWWNASKGNDPEVWRWWDGKYWSVMALPHLDAKKAGLAAKTRTKEQGRVRWRYRYPENARVPRVNPNKVPL